MNNLVAKVKWSLFNFQQVCPKDSRRCSLSSSSLVLLFVSRSSIIACFRSISKRNFSCCSIKAREEEKEPLKVSFKLCCHIGNNSPKWYKKGTSWKVQTSGALPFTKPFEVKLTHSRVYHYFCFFYCTHTWISWIHDIQVETWSILISILFFRSPLSLFSNNSAATLVLVHLIYLFVYIYIYIYINIWLLIITT